MKKLMAMLTVEHLLTLVATVLRMLLVWRFLILHHSLNIGVTFPHSCHFQLESLLTDFSHGLNLAVHALFTGCQVFRVQLIFIAS